MLNDDPRQSITPETRERVLQAAAALGYRPSAAARTLRSGRSQLVLVVVQFELVDPNIALRLRALEQGLAAHGYSLVWYVGTPLHPHEPHPAENLTPAAVVFFGDDSGPGVEAFLRRFGVPVVPLGLGGWRDEVGRLQVGVLHKRGHRRIVFATPERADLQWLTERQLVGVRAQCEELGFQVPHALRVPATREAAGRVLADVVADAPLGFCCYNDEVALAVLAALADLGVPVPGVAAVIGCDDIPLAQLSHPPLTTVAFSSDSGSRLLEDVLAAVRGEPAKEPLGMELRVVERASV